MAYQVLARKWRPQDFESVVGQEPVVTALRNALAEERIAAAYLFSGIRGVGKTSVARILAKALNCERGMASGPCNECPTCREFGSGANLDILEIDAATHSKVEQVRELTENLKYRPVAGRYKVVVLDEVHRLSRQAFDALLKIVEEPPSHLVFIFATTELESVPATILSRCQEFNFQRVPRPEVAAHLRRLADAERIEVGDKALLLIARAGEGSVRDAVALLDQLATYGSGRIADEDAARILGGVETALHHRLLEAILANDRAGVVAIVADIEGRGRDPRHVYGEFLAYCRDALHLALGGDIAVIELPDEEARAAQSLAAAAGYENLLRLTNQLLAGEEAVRRSESASLAVEIAWLRGAELPRLTRLEELLGKPSPAGGASETTGDEPAAESGATAPGPTAAGGAPALTSPEGSTAAADLTGGGIERFLELIKTRRQVIAAHLEEVEALDFEDGTLLLTTAEDDSWLEHALQRKPNLEVFEECLRQAFGPDARWRLRPTATSETPAADETAEESASSPAVLEHPTVQAALDVFGGTAEPIEDSN